LSFVTSSYSSNNNNNNAKYSQVVRVLGTALSGAAMTAILQQFSYIHRPVNHPVVCSRLDTPPRCGIDLPQAQLRHLHVMSRRTAIINGKQTCALTWHGSGHDGIWRNNL